MIHGGWPYVMAQRLNQHVLGDRYRAGPMIHRGATVEIDVGTFDQGGPAHLHDEGEGNGVAVATATWAPPRAAVSCEIEFDEIDTYEIQVHDTVLGQLVAAIELISPANKDRPAARHAFAVKCASLLYAGVAVTIIDIVTNRHTSLHAGLADLLGVTSDVPDPGMLYAVTYRIVRTPAGPRLQVWPHELTIGSPLPTLPLWLAVDLAVPLELETTYEDACAGVRIR
jgi:hypothetical protein